MEDLEMKPTPPALKWLAEKRARVAAKLERGERLLEDVQAQVVKHRGDLAALDQTLAVYDSAIDASTIEPVAGWAGSYGKRGSLKEFLAHVVETRSPTAVSTRELMLLSATQFGLAFETDELLLRWKRNSMLRALKNLTYEGKLEPTHQAKSGEMGAWRWKRAEAVTLAQLRAVAPTLEVAEDVAA